MKPRTCLLIGCWLAGLVVGVVRGQGVTARTWVGHFSVSWSNPNNWDPVGVPQDGENLIFTGAGPPLQEIHMNNDLVNLRVRDFLFCGVGWSLDGNELTLLDDVNRDGGCGDSSFLFNYPLRLGDSMHMEIGWGSIILKGSIDLNGNNLGLVSADRIIVSGQITGTGNVFAAIDGSIRESSIIFDGPTGNTFSGRLTVYQSYPQIGQVVFDKQSGAVVNDALVIGDEQSVHRAICKLARSHQIGDNAKVCVVRGGQFLLEGHTETIGSLCLTNCALDTTPSLVDTGGATLSVQGDITSVNDATGIVPTIRGLLGLPGAAVAFRRAKDAAP